MQVMLHQENVSRKRPISESQNRPFSDTLPLSLCSRPHVELTCAKSRVKIKMSKLLACDK